MSRSGGYNGNLNKGKWMDEDGLVPGLRFGHCVLRSVCQTAAMVSLQSFENCFINGNVTILRSDRGKYKRQQGQAILPTSTISRRSAILISVLPLMLVSAPPQSSEARERRNRRTIPLEEYLTSC